MSLMAPLNVVSTAESIRRYFSHVCPFIINTNLYMFGVNLSIITMASAGSLFYLKTSPEELKAELTPAFTKIIEAFLSRAVEEPLANSVHFFEKKTLLERKGPLDRFLTNVFNGLRRPGPTILPLRMGFGFGKTHAEILLLHATLSFRELPELTKQALRDMGWSEELASKIIVIPIDFYVKEHPSVALRRVMKAYADRRARFWRGGNLAEEVKKYDFDSLGTSSDFLRP